MVVAPWRRFTSVARWNGHADHRMTGVDSANATHSQPGELQAGHHRDRDHRDAQDHRDHEARTQVAQLVGLGVVGLGVGHRVAEIGDGGRERRRDRCAPGRR